MISLSKKCTYKKIVNSSFYSFIFFLLSVVLVQKVLYASTHSKLKKPQQLERFKEISLKLVCQCGCKTLLDSCNHLTCMAWSMRSIIDSLIVNDYSNAFIINGFEKGFGKLAKNAKVMPILENEKYRDYKINYKDGFGRPVHSEPRNDNFTMWFIVLSSLGILFFVILFISRNKKTIVANAGGPKQLSKKEEELWDRLYRG